MSDARCKTFERPESSSHPQCNETENSAKFGKNKAAEPRVAQPGSGQGWPRRCQGPPSRGTPDPGGCPSVWALPVTPGQAQPPPSAPPPDAQKALTHRDFLPEVGGKKGKKKIKDFMTGPRLVAMLLFSGAAAGENKRGQPAFSTASRAGGSHCPAGEWIYFFIIINVFLEENKQHADYWRGWQLVGRKSRAEPY